MEQENTKTSCERVKWVDWLISSQFGVYFVEIDPEFLDNTFNVYGIRQKIPHFKLAWDLIRGPYVSPEDYPNTWPSTLNDYAIMLYGALHARYLMTAAGMRKMHDKYKSDLFDKCPRTLCKGVRGLPYGEHDDFGKSGMRLFCPSCCNIYRMKNLDGKVLDGSFFGPSWIHTFLTKYRELTPENPPEEFVPRLFGYQLYDPDVNF